ncbi:MAG: flagellar modification protein B [Gammaproteobacteria bacterium RIFCSPHIGHO2_12_FULL_36_30]|nr:MAG: flagellar modification protein B [Gammaproteobacteria bacterium RIFCSPHIGHO2_12_FULL_36_30]
MKVLCTICARGGSQGVKNKNLISLRRKPLIAHSILQAKKSRLFDMVAVSSDSKKILSVAKKWGADYVIERPLELATSTAAKIPVIQHAVSQAEIIAKTKFDIIVDLDATAPLRTVDDLKASLALFLKNNRAMNLITGYPSRKSPYFNIVETDNANFAKLSKKTEIPVIRRQDTPSCYDMNASIYIWKRNALFQQSSIVSDHTLLYVMPEERSIDIDTPIDLALVRILAKNRRDLV